MCFQIALCLKAVWAGFNFHLPSISPCPPPSCPPPPAPPHPPTSLLGYLCAGELRTAACQEAVRLP